MAPPTTFASLLPVTQTSSHTYTVNLSDDFCIGTVPNGGYITTAFLLAARTHMTLTHPTLSTPNPINLHLEFLRRTSAGPATFHIKDIKLGRRISNLHLTLRQHLESNDPSSPIQDEVEGYITLTNLATESGPTHNTEYTLLPTPVPTNLTHLAHNKDDNYILRRPDPYGNFRRGSFHSEMYLVRPERRRNDTSPAIADQWVRFRPVPNPSSYLEQLKTGTLQKVEGRWTNDALGYLVDIFPQLNERYVNAEIEDAVLKGYDEISDEEIRELVRGKKKTKKERAAAAAAQEGKREEEEEEGEGGVSPIRSFWYPTLLLNLDVKKLLPEEGVDWLFVRVQAKSIARGRFDLNVEVWDEEGDLVALSTHASLILDASRNLTRTKANSKAKTKTKKESKM